MYEIWIRVSHHQRLSDLPLPQTFSGLFLNFTALQYLKTIHKILYHPKFVWGYWLHGTLQFCALDVVDCKFVFQQESVSVKPSSWSEPVKAARSPRFQPEDGVLRRKIRRPFAITVFFHCLWVWKGRTDVGERVYRLGSSPWPNIRVGFGVSQSGCEIAQISAGRWGAAAGDHVALCLRSKCFSTAYGYGKGGQM